jgi:hypothetical protein
VRAVRPFLPGLIVLRADERVTDYRGYAEPGGWQLFAVAVHPLGVLAERALHPDRFAQQHVSDRAARAFHRDRLAADRVGRAGQDDRCGDAACQRVGEAGVGGVDPVKCAQPGAIRAGRLVEVVAGPAAPLLVDAEMRV